MTGHSKSLLFAKELYASPSGKEQAALTDRNYEKGCDCHQGILASPRVRDRSALCPLRLPLAEAIVQIRTRPAYELFKEFLPLPALSASAVSWSRV